MKHKILWISLSFLLMAALVLASGAKEIPGEQEEVVVATSTLGREIWTPLAGSMPEQFPAQQWYEYLLYRGVGDDTNLYPGLAESWSISADMLTYTFNIRQDVEFNEGWGPLTAEDVLYSYQLIGSEESTNALRWLIVEYIEDMEVVSPYVFRVKLYKPYVNFLMSVSSRLPYLMIVSKKYFEAVGAEEAMRHPVGSGPFVWKKHVLGDYIESEAVDNHWRKTADFKTLKLKIVPEQGARIAMLRAGEADLIELSTLFVDEVEAAGFKVLNNPGASFYTLHFGGLCLPERAGWDPDSPWGYQDDPVKAERALMVRKALA